MPDVKIKQNKDSANLTLDATIEGQTKRLVAGVYQTFTNISSGEHVLKLVGIHGGTGPVEFKLDLVNAERPNGDAHIIDLASPNYVNKLVLEVPGA